MRMKEVRRIAVGTVVLAGGVLAVGAPPATAACHAFTIAVSPATVTEGAAVNVTVERDAGVNPSSVKVTSINESATAGSDFTAVSRTISFTSETEQTFTVPTTNDAAAEATETFRLHLSEPGGCPINTNFVIGPDATVTIADNDQVAAAPTTTRRPIGNPPTRPGQPTTTAAGATTTESATSTTEETTTTTGRDSVVIEDEDDDSPVAAILLGLGAVAVLGAAGYAFYRRRNAPAP